MGRPRARVVPIRQSGAVNLIILLLLFVAVTFAGVALGRYSAERGVQVSPAALAAVQTRLSETRESLDVALNELEVLRMQREVDQQALKILRAEMAAERERTATIEESLSFYRSLMDSDGAKGAAVAQARNGSCWRWENCIPVLRATAAERIRPVKWLPLCADPRASGCRTGRLYSGAIVRRFSRRICRVAVSVFSGRRGGAGAARGLQAQ